jgi:hypothetical protein
MIYSWGHVDVPTMILETVACDEFVDLGLFIIWFI